MNYKKYITNISGLQFIRLFRFSVLFIIGIIFSHSFNQKQVGEYELLLFLSSAISFFWLSGLTQSFLSLSTTNNKDKAGKSNIFFNAFILIFFLNILVIIFLTLFKSTLAGFLLNTGKIPYFNLLLVYIFFSNPSFLIEYIYLIRNKAGNIIKYGILGFTAQLLLVGLPPILGCSLEYSLYGLIAISVIRFFWLIMLISKTSLFTISFPYIKKHIKTGLPLILSILISGSAQYIDGIIISSYYKDEAFFAVFRFGSRELPLILLADAFSNAMIPEISNSNDMKATLRKIRRSSLNIMHLIFPVTIILLITSHWFYPFLFTNEYTESAKIFNTYLLLTTSRLVFPQTILIGKKRNLYILFSSIIELTINVSLSLLLIQYFGLVGVALATVIAYFADKLILVLFNMRDKIYPASYIPMRWLSFYSLIIIVLYFIMDWNLLSIIL